MKIPLSLLLLWCCCYAATAQETKFTTTGDYLTIGIGVPVHTARDRAHSALAYRGWGLRLFAGHEKITERGLYRFDLVLDDVTLKAKVRPRGDVRRSAASGNLEMSFGYYRRLNHEAAPSNHSQYVGGTYAVQLSNRDYPLPANNLTSVLGHSSLSIGALDRRGITDNQRWLTTTRVDLPVLTLLYRPSYIGIPPLLHVPHAKFKDAFGTTRLVTVNKFFKLKVGIDVDYQSQAWRTDRVAYDWSILHTPLPAGKPLTAAFGSLGYGFRVLL